MIATDTNTSRTGHIDHGIWINNPKQAHQDWRSSLVVSSGRPYAEHSTALYVSLFGRFCTWMIARHLTLRSIKGLDLALFIDSLTGRNDRAANNRTQRSYIAEIDRVMAMLQTIGFRDDNPARELLAQMQITTPMKPRAIMFMRPEIQKQYESAIQKLDPSSLDADQVRAHAIACLILAMGMTVKEIQKLVLTDVTTSTDASGSVCLLVRAPGHRLLQARSDTLPTQASRWLMAWLHMRKALRIITPLRYRQIGVIGHARVKALDDTSAAPIADHLARVFVTLAGKGNWHTSGLRGHGIAINRLREEVVHDAARLVFSLGDQRPLQNKQDYCSPQTLRNAFGARLLNEGLSDEEVSRKMGLVTLDQIWALKRSAMVRQTV